MHREWDLETDSTRVPRPGSWMSPQRGVDREDSPFGGDPVNPAWGDRARRGFLEGPAYGGAPGGLSTTGLGGVPQ